MFSFTCRSDEFLRRLMLRASIAILVTLSLFILPLDARSADGEVLLDEVMAAINSKAVTRSQVIRETRIVLVENRQNWAGRLSVGLLESVLRRLVGKELIYQEMERSGYRFEDDPERFDGQALLAGFQASFGSRQSYTRFLLAIESSEESMIGALKRNAKIEAFMERRLSLLAHTSEEEIRREVARLKAEGRISGDNLVVDDSFIAYVRGELERKKYDLALAQWLKDLSGRNRVLFLKSFENDVPAVIADDWQTGMADDAKQ